MKMLLKSSLLFLFIIFMFLCIIQNQFHMASAENMEQQIASRNNEESVNYQTGASKITVTVLAGKEAPRTIKTKSCLVSEVLDEMGIKITGDDRVIPAPNTQLQDNMTIEVVFVEQKIFTEKAVLDYPTSGREDPSMPAGSKIIVQYGKEGIVENTIRIWYKNGE